MALANIHHVLRIHSSRCWFAKLMQKVCGKRVFPLFKLFLCDATLLEDGDIEGVLLALEKVRVHKVDNLATILPGPSTQDSGSIHCVCSHVVIKQGVKVEV